MFCLIPLIRPTDIIKGVKKWQTFETAAVVVTYPSSLERQCPLLV